ncbi:MAG: hypothetical protein DRJ03_03710 [Chloroflexi bacterium]|nr:MAG: hypothetical protein DRJ03_03710 [Chloroflexota bacterium]
MGKNRKPIYKLVSVFPPRFEPVREGLWDQIIKSNKLVITYINPWFFLVHRIYEKIINYVYDKWNRKGAGIVEKMLKPLRFICFQIIIRSKARIIEEMYEKSEGDKN